jgi:hypothetical protein
MADELVAKLLAKPDIPGVCTELLRNKDEFIADTDISAILVQLSPQNHSNAYVALLYVLLVLPLAKLHVLPSLG